MTSTVVIRSPAQNTQTIAVLTQTLDAEGAPVGNPEVRAILDDGEDCIMRVSPNQCVVVLEHPRNQQPAAPAPEPETLPEADGTLSTQPLPPTIGSGGLPPDEQAA